MEIHQVRYFLAVCEEKNFTRAAKKSNVSQPSLTRAIQMLEKEFGGNLFDRARASVEMTELGKIVLPYLQDVWRQSTKAKVAAEDFVSNRPHNLHLGIMCTIAPKLFVNLLSSFRASHPSIQINLIDGNAEMMEEKLFKMDVEAAIYCLPHRQPDPRLNYLPLFREQMMIVLPEGHPLSLRTELEMKDLASEQYVQRINCEFNKSDVTTGPQAANDTCIHKSDRDDWVLSMIASGFGYGFVPEHSINQNGLTACRLVNPECWRSIDLVTVRDRPHSPAVGALIYQAMNIQWV